MINGAVTNTADTQIQISLGLLLDVAVDRNSHVADSVNTSLCKIAQKHPNEVLKACCTFANRTEPKANADHLNVVLAIMEDICKEHIVYIDGDTIINLINLCLDLMTRNAAHEPNIQMPASGVLVALGTKHCIQVIDGLMTKLSAGVVPHYTVPHTLGSLAAANAYGIVPYLKNILGILLPMFGGLKLDVIRQAFAYCLGKFSEAILEYTTNPEQAPDPTITVDDYHTEIAMAYDVMFAVWIHAREQKLVETVLYSMAAMFNILSEDKVRQYTTKSIQVLLGHYRKQKGAQAVTKCLGSIISVASQQDGTLLEPQLVAVLQALSELVCVSPDYAQPELLRTHSEVLRCFECLCVHYTDHTIEHIVSQMKSNNDKERIKGLVVLTHLINSAEGTIKGRVRFLLQVLEGMLNEHNLRVRKALMKAIVTVAYRGMLTNSEISPEKYIQFIVRLCCKQYTYAPTEQQELVEVKQTADNTLYMLSTSVKDLENILWNILLKCLLAYEYSDACIILLRCLTHLASRKATGKETCEAGFVRCLGLLAHPLDNFRGTFILNFLRNIRPSASELYCQVWDTRLPYLLKYLEQNYDSFNAAEWEELVFDFLAVLLGTVKEQEFHENLVRCIRDQLPLYVNRPSEPDLSMKNQEKNLLLKCLAVISCRLENKALIQEILDLILQSVKLNDTNELQACAEAIGIASRTHLDLVLDKLYTVRKDVLLKKNNKFFQLGFMKDQKGESEIDKVKYAVIASYAQICNEAPTDALLRILQSQVLSFIVHELKHCKEPSIRRICLKAIGSAADAYHPNRNKLHVQLQDRDKILKLVAEQMQLHNGPEYIELFPIIIPVLTALVKLPNILESDERLALLRLCFKNVFDASAIYCKLNNATGPGDVKLSPYVFASFSKVNLLVQELLVQNISPATLDEIFTLLENWLSRKKLEHRLPALEALRTALQTYLDNVKFAYEGPTTFGQTGIILSRIIPRCTDPHKTTRKVAVECVCLMLCISGRYEGRMRDHDKSLSNALLHVQEEIDTDDPKHLFNLINDLATVICRNIPKHQLYHFVDTLQEGLLDLEPSSSNGTSVVLNAVIKQKGGDLQPVVTELLEKLLFILEKITCVRTKSTAMGAVLSLATHHVKPVVNVILQQPLPYDQCTCSCWSVLASDRTLIYEIVEQLKKILKTGNYYEEQKNADNMRIATLKPLQAICGLFELFKSKESHEVCRQQFPELFSLLYIALASYLNTAAPIFASARTKEAAVPNRGAYKLNTFKICLDTFKLFLQNADSKQSATSLLLCADSLVSFLALVPILAEGVYAEYSQSLAWLVAALGPYIRSEVEPQRVAVAAFFASLLKFRVNNETLAEDVLEMLLNVHLDASYNVRQLSLRGIGYAAEFLGPELVQRHVTVILNALMQGLDYNAVSESEVALESMLSFSKLLKVVDSSQLGQCQVTASVRIKPLLQHESEELREASIMLFGDLAKSVGPDDAFSEQIHGNLITLLLHLCDVDANVVLACKNTLRKIGPFLECTRVNALIQEHLPNEAKLYFSQFCVDFVKSMGEDMQEYFPQFVMTCMAFFKSTWTDIRANSAFLAGLLYAQTSPEFRSGISLDTLSYRLLQLLKDTEPEVRARAVEALAYIFTV